MELMIDAIGAVESVKAASDIYAPVSGIIEAINETLADQPSLLNKKPQSDGTFFYFSLPRSVLSLETSTPRATREQD
jgi:glycine cleavage system H lipoate-binding protein